MKELEKLSDGFNEGVVFASCMTKIDLIQSSDMRSLLCEQLSFQRGGGGG